MNRSALEQRRSQILEAMRSIRAMRPGVVSEQYLKVPQKGKAQAALRGPYYLWQYYDKGKPVRQRLTSAHEVAVARQEVENYRRFTQLCKEFEELTRRLGELEREQAAQKEAEKKSSKSRKSGNRK